jgi:hypothetical protein
MPIPTAQDHLLGEIDDLHAGILVSLRVWMRAGPDRDTKRIREGLQDYVDKVVAFTNGGDQ